MRLSDPIKPPEYWPTLKAREKRTPTGPYSVNGIRESLSNDVMPVGYAKEQLEMFGFAPEVRAFRKRAQS